MRRRASLLLLALVYLLGGSGLLLGALERFAPRAVARASCCCDEGQCRCVDCCLHAPREESAPAPRVSIGRCAKDDAPTTSPERGQAPQDRPLTAVAPPLGAPGAAARPRRPSRALSGTLGGPAKVPIS